MSFGSSNLIGHVKKTGHYSKALVVRNPALVYHKVTSQHEGGTYVTSYSDFIKKIRITQVVMVLAMFIGGIIFSLPKLQFASAATDINFSGVAYTGEGVTPLDGTAVNKTVFLSVNGVYTGTDEITDNTGAWAINTVSVNTGDIITIYLDNETEEATTVMVSNETTQTNVDLYQNYVIVRADTGSISNANLDTGDDTDDDIKYSVDVSDNITIDSGFNLHIWTGDTYTPAGTVTTQGSGDVHVTSSAIFNAAGYTVTVNGSWDNDGTFTHGDNTVTFNGSSGTQTIDSTDATTDNFYDVVINDGGGTATIQLANTNITVDNDLTITDGIFETNSLQALIAGNFEKTGGNLKMDFWNDYIDVDGNFTVSGNDGSQVIDAGTIRVAGDVAISNDNTFQLGATNGTDLYMDGTNDANLSISGANNHLGTSAQDSELLIQKTDSTDKITLLTDVNGSRLSLNEGIVDINGNTATFSGLFRGNSGASLTMASGGLVVGSNAYCPAAPFSIYSGFTENISGGTIQVYGCAHATNGTALFSDGSVFTPAGGAFQFMGTDAASSIYVAETDAADFNFWNLTLGDDTNAKTVEIDTDSAVPIDVNGNLTISSNATFDSNGKPIEVSGSWDNNNVYTHDNNTVTFNGSSGTQTIDSTDATTDNFYDVVINDGGGTGTAQLVGTDITVDNDFTLTDGIFDLNNLHTHITGNFIKTGGDLQINQSSDRLFVDGDFTVSGDDGASDISNGYIVVDGSVVISNDASFVMGGAGFPELRMAGSGDTSITVTGTGNSFGSNSAISVLRIHKTSESDTVTLSGTVTGYELLVYAGQLDVADNTATFTNGCMWWWGLNGLELNGGTLTCGRDGLPSDEFAFYTTGGFISTISGGTINVYGGEGNQYGIAFDMASTFAPTNGNTFRIIGTDSATLYLTDSDSANIAFNNLVIGDGSNARTVTIHASSSPVSVTDDLTISTNSTLDSNGKDFSVGGNWDNDGSYTHGDNTVTLNATTGSPKTIDADGTGSEAFYDLTLDDTGNDIEWDLSTLMDVDNDLTITGGTFDANGNALTIGGSWNNDDTFTHGDNSVTFDSDDTGETIEAGASPFYDVEFNHASGGWTIQTDNMTVANDLDITNASAFAVESGRTVEVQGNFTNAVGGANTTWTGSTLYLNDTSELDTINTKLAGSDTYATLRIGTTEGIGMWNSNASTLTIDSGGCLESFDHNSTDGQLNIYGSCNSRSNEYWSYATDFDGTSLSGGSERLADINLNADSSYTIDQADTLQVMGQSATANRTAISRISSGNYGMTVAGTISARYYDFDYLNSSGLNIASTATVSELSDGTFDNIGSGAGPSYITVNGITSTDSFSNVVFDSDVDGADSNATYNVNADGSGIDWTFVQSSGNKNGEDNDNELNGASIQWTIYFSEINDGLSSDLDVTNSTTQLSANWSTISDDDIDYFTYAIGTTSGGNDVVDYTNTGVSKNFTKTGLTLTNGMTYYITIRAYDSDDELLESITSDGITVDTTAPIFSNINTSSTQTSITVRWTTNESTTTQVRYGLTEEYGLQTEEDVTLITSHTASITGLNEDTTYHFQLVGEDEAGNIGYSNDYSAETNALEATVITNVQVTALFPTSVAVTWDTNHLADSKVRYGLSTDYGLEEYDSELVTEHALQLTGLEPDTQYHYEVISTGNSVAIDADATFQTQEEEEEPYLPAPTVLAPEFGSTINSAFTTITGVAQSENDVFILIDRRLAAVVKASDHSSGTGDFHYHINNPLTRGSHSIVVRARDNDGLVSSESIPHTFFAEPDYPAPTIVKSYVTDGTNPAIVLFGLALNDANVRVYVGDKMINTFLVDNHPSGTANFQVIITGLDPGAYDIRLDAVEFGGKESTKTNPLKVVINPLGSNLPIYVYQEGDQYTVQSGDTLWQIAMEHFGMGGRWVVIQEANIGEHPSLQFNPYALQIGWRLLLPFMWSF